jgi:hypothetical protein
VFVFDISADGFLIVVGLTLGKQLKGEGDTGSCGVEVVCGGAKVGSGVWIHACAGLQMACAA